MHASSTSTNRPAQRKPQVGSLKPNQSHRVGAPTLLEHQIAEVAFLREHTRALLLSETGTGKTVSMLTRCREVLESGGVVTWVTTRSLISQLRTEAMTWLPGDLQPTLIGQAPGDSRFILATHGEARMRVATLSKPGLLDMIVIDEAAVLRSGGWDKNAATYTALRKISHAACMAIVATAEPLDTTHALDLWAIADVAGIPEILSRQDMYQRVEWREYQEGRWPVRKPIRISTRGFRELLSYIRPYQTRTILASVAERPLVKTREHYVPLSNDAAQRYALGAATEGLSGHQQRNITSRDSDSLIPATLNLLTTTYRDHKSAVIFTENFDLLTPLAQGLSRAGISFAQVDGKQTSKQRAAAVEGHRSAEFRVLLMTSAGEFGLNLQHASLLMTVVRSYSPARERQREGRLVRLGSPHREIIHAIVMPDVSHEVRREQILDEKGAMITHMWEFLR